MTRLSPLSSQLGVTVSFIIMSALEPRVGNKHRMRSAVEDIVNEGG